MHYSRLARHGTTDTPKATVVCERCTIKWEWIVVGKYPKYCPTCRPLVQAENVSQWGKAHKRKACKECGVVPQNCVGRGCISKLGLCNPCTAKRRYIVKEKQCKLCFKTKSRDQFYFGANFTDGIDPRCKECRAEQERAKALHILRPCECCGKQKVLDSDKPYYGKRYRCPHPHKKCPQCKECVALTDIAANGAWCRRCDATNQRERRKLYPEQYNNEDSRLRGRMRNSWRREKINLLTPEDKKETFEYRKKIQNDRCFYCGALGSTDDHYFSLSQGGTDHWWNLVRACQFCNFSKSDKCGDCFIAKEPCACEVLRVLDEESYLTFRFEF